MQSRAVQYHTYFGLPHPAEQRHTMKRLQTNVEHSLRTMEFQNLLFGISAEGCSAPMSHACTKAVRTRCSATTITRSEPTPINWKPPHGDSIQLKEIKLT